MDWGLVSVILSGSGLVGLVGYVLKNERRVSTNEQRIAALEGRADSHSDRWESLTLQLTGVQNRLTEVSTKLDMLLDGKVNIQAGMHDTRS